MNKDLSAPIWTAAYVYLSGLAGMLILEALLREVWPGSRLGAAPWWAWMGGLLSIGSTVAGLMLAQKMGSGTFTGISVTAGLVASILLDQFGLMGFKPHPAHAMRIVGAGLMIGGLWLIAKF